MGQEYGHVDNPVVPVIQHIKTTILTSEEIAFRETLIALAMVYRRDARNPVNQAIRSVILCEKEVYGRREDQFLEAIRIVFAPKVPIVYPDQFRPVIILSADGHVLWSATDQVTVPVSEESPP